MRDLTKRSRITFRTAPLLAVFAVVVLAVEVDATMAGDMAIQSTVSRETVYIPNELEGTIYKVTVPGSAEEFQISRESFKVFLHSPKVPHPRSLAIDAAGGNLIVVNAEPAAILQVNLETAEVSTIWQGWPLRAPSTAVSVGDTTVVADAAVGGVFLLRPGQKPELNPDSSLSRAAKLVAAPQSVLVFNADSGSTLSFRLVGERNNYRNRLQPLPSEVRAQVARGYSDFAYRNGIAYVTVPGLMFVFVLGDDTAYSYESSAIRPGTRIVAGGRQIFLLDPSGSRLDALPRAVPSTFRFEATLADAQKGILQLLGYLQRRSLLGHRGYQVAQDVTSAQRLLISAGVLPDGPRKFTADAEADARNLVCVLNSCNASNRFVPNAIMQVPNSTVENFLFAETINLAGKSISQALEERVFSARLRAQITVKYVTELNGSRLASSSKTRTDYEPLSANGEALQLGDIVKVNGGRSLLVGNISSCGIYLTPSIAPYAAKTPIVQGDKALSYLIRATGSKIAARDLEAAGASSLAIQFRDTGETSIDPILFTKALQGLRSNCLDILLGPDIYVVSDVIQARTLDATFLSDTNTPVSLSRSQLVRLGLDTTRYSTPYTATIRPETPVQLSYRLLQLDDLKHFSWPTENDQLIRDGERQDIFWMDKEWMDKGQLVLPVEHWQMTVLVPTSDVYGETSTLRELARTIPGMSYPRSSETLPFTAKAVPGPGSPVPPDRLAAAFERRRQILSDIGYAAAHMQSITLIRDAYIGVVEDEQSVDKQHADFWDANGEGAWYEMVDNCLLSPSKHEPTSIPPALKEDFNVTTDHGTYIAALIAGRSGKLGPGLAPQTGLILLPPTGELPQFIQDANCRSVSIFNFSLSADESVNLRDNGVVLNSLKNELKNTDALFIVAAGDGGADLDSQGSVPPPISWAVDVPNLIGVAASDGRHIAKTNAQGRNVSNYGRRYVQLAAPGTQIPSAGAQNSYVIAEGSSPAVAQVAAVASVLLAENASTKPQVIKARLMYTADSFSDLDADVWGGGRLNFDRAVWQPFSNLLITNTSDPLSISIAKLQPTPVEISGEEDSPSALPHPVRIRVPTTRLLRVTDDNAGNGLKRVIYLDDGNRMRIVVRATLRGSFKCASNTSAVAWDEPNHTVVPRNECSTPINMEQVKDYVASVPLTVVF